MERKQLVTKNQNPGSVAGSSGADSVADSFDPESLANSFWKKTICIHKDHVFPLYCEALDYTN